MIKIEYIFNWGMNDQYSKFKELNKKELDRLIHLDQFYYHDTLDDGSVIMSNDKNEALIIMSKGMV